MRIGFDMLAVQSPHHGQRGIGRYSGNLVSTILDSDSPHEYILYVHDDLPFDRVPEHPKADLRRIRPSWEQGEAMSPFMDRLVSGNPDRLDLFVVLSPFEKWAHYNPPTRSMNGPKVVAIVYDLIPFLFQNESVVDPVLVRHYRVLEELTRYDALLAISEATRKDCVSVLRLSPDRIVNISGASDSRSFYPSRSAELDPVRAGEFRDLGINKPFILNVGGLDERKNTWKLIDAYATLPPALRENHQLVITFAIDEWGRGHVLEHCRRAGLAEGSVILTGEVTDETLLALYQRCELFAFPSVYEGFGLPILEALHCGAAVIAGNNSSQIEVIGDAGLLVDVTDVHEIASKLEDILENPELKNNLREQAPKQAARFSWEATAKLALDVFQTLEASSKPERASYRFDSAHSLKPTIAFFSPFPPRKSGISDYSAFLLDELTRDYRIDLYHDSGYIPEPALASPEFACADYRLFDRIAAAKNYHAIVYQMGNSRYHNYMYDMMRRHPGVVTLHDFCLAGFHLHFGHSRGYGLDFIREELIKWHPESRPVFEAVLDRNSRDWDYISRTCANEGWFLNRTILEESLGVVVHSPWCAEQIHRSSPEHAKKVAIIPHGIHTKQIEESSRLEVRSRFGIPRDALVFASFGFVHPDKMNPQALDAFAEIAATDEKALYIFVGEDADGGEVRRHAESLGLKNRVRFFGRQPADCFADLITVSDIGVNLRMPPTNGETSGALLNLLASGVPTIVTEVATFSDYPADVVSKVHWERDGRAGLLHALKTLADNAEARAALGRAAWAYVDEHHEWSRVAKLYVNAIEAAHRLSRSSAVPPKFERGGRGPHTMGRSLASSELGS